MSFFVYGGSVKNTIQLFETKSKYNNAHPNFNEEFVLQTTGDWKKIDIQISIKVTLLSWNPHNTILELFHNRRKPDNRTLSSQALEIQINSKYTRTCLII